MVEITDLSSLHIGRTYLVYENTFTPNKYRATFIGRRNINTRGEIYDFAIIQELTPNLMAYANRRGLMAYNYIDTYTNPSRVINYHWQIFEDIGSEGQLPPQREPPPRDRIPQEPPQPLEELEPCDIPLPGNYKLLPGEPSPCDNPSQGNDEKGIEKSQCSICLQSICCNQAIQACTACRKIYHYSCTDQPGIGSCPQCRAITIPWRQFSAPTTTVRGAIAEQMKLRYGGGKKSKKISAKQKSSKSKKISAKQKKSKSKKISAKQKKSKSKKSRKK
jgi:hypothetical protein